MIVILRRGNAVVTNFTLWYTSHRLDMLKGQADYFEDALDGVLKRVEGLEAKAER